MDYARIDGSANIPHIKRNVKAYLDVLIEWLQSLYNSMHGHATSQDSQDREMEEAFDLFDVTSSNAANVESTVRQEFSLYQKDCLNYVRNRPVLKWVSEREEKFPHVTKLARCVFAIVGSQIDNERVFSAAGVISKNRRNRIGIQNMDSIMHIYHNYPNEVVEKDSAPSLAEISSDQPRPDTLKRYISEMTDAEIDLLIDVEDDSAVTECE